MSESDDFDDQEPKTPTVTIAFEYIEAQETFNFYIRRVSHAPFTPSLYPKYSKAVMHVVKGLTRKTWMGRKRSITWEPRLPHLRDFECMCSQFPQVLPEWRLKRLPPAIKEMLTHEPLPFRTLAVPRCITTVFNEFFSCQIPRQLFHNSLMKIEFCDVSKDDYEVAIAECEYWLDTNPIERFREFELPMTISSPDLGELELSITYLPTAQRLLVTNYKATNLRVDPNAEELHVRAILFVNGRFDEIHKSEHRLPSDETPNGWNFAKKLVFDLLRSNVRAALLVCQAVQKTEGVKRVIGQCEIKNDCGQWIRMLKTLREPSSETYRLRPAV